MRKLLFPLLLLFAIPTSMAQNLNFYGLFPVYNQTGRIYKKWEYSIYLFAAINTFDQTIEGVTYPAKVFMIYDENALVYNASKKLGFAVSYTYQRTDPFLSSYVNEHRIWAQVGYKQFLNKTTLRHRLRFDQRYIQDRATDTYPAHNRLRYLIGIEFPLKKESNKYYFTAYQEFFFTTSTPRDAVYGENWAYAGIGVRTQKAGAFEIGPTYITWVRNADLDRLNLWYLQLTWNTTINFTKTEQPKAE